MRNDLLRPRLEREHALWLQEVRAALGPAERPEAGPWARWNALRYLETVFPERVGRERRMVEAVAPRLSEAQRSRLWALGELLDVLPAYLGHLIGLCHRAGEFSAGAGRVRAALDRWCRAVEEDLGDLPASALAAEPTERGGTRVEEPVAGVS